MKKLLALFLTIATVFALSACTPDKSSQDTPNAPIEQTINLDNCYVCPIYFNGEEHCMTAYTDLSDGFYNKMYYIIGYYIENDVIREYNLGAIWYGDGQYQIEEIEDFNTTQGLIAEYHGVSNYSISIMPIHYWVINTVYTEFIWTWGEYKQVVEKYNTLSKQMEITND